MGFGWFKGVFVPSTEAILGTVLFLLLPALVGDVGLWTILAVIALAHTVTTATSFSLADCATNLHSIGPGGMYALSKRSLGKAFGGSIGIQLYVAQAASIGFYCVGFAEALQPLIEGVLSGWLNQPAPDELLQKQLIASVVFLVFLLLTMIGADFTIKLQLLILVVLGASVASIFAAPYLEPSFKGIPIFEGWSKNAHYGIRPLTIGLFFSTFAQFFPAVTGIDTGVGMSGDLKEPRTALVKGTFSAIAVTFVIYMASAFIFAQMDPALLVTDHTESGPVGYLLPELLGLYKGFPDNLLGITVISGIFLATGSSALGCFMTAPRTLQSLAQDDILPRFARFVAFDFARGGKEPRFATLVTSVLSLSVIWIGNINTASTIVGICFLVVYGWVNGSAFLERISGNPTFRPTSKGHWSISLYGFLACMSAIMLFSPTIGIIILLTQYFLFMAILRYKATGRFEGVWWGALFSTVMSGLRSLSRISQGSKNWRPMLTAIGFARPEGNHDRISYLADMMASHKGLSSMNVLAPLKAKHVDSEDAGDPDKLNVIYTKHPTTTALGIIQADQISGLSSNSVLIEYSPKMDMLVVVQQILNMGKNLFLMVNAERLFQLRRIDIWWRGERNGNLMVLLAYIVRTSIHQATGENIETRIIRKPGPDEDPTEAALELQNMLEKARLPGEIMVLPQSDADFIDTLEEISSGADLILMGVPGNYIDSDTGRKFRLDEFFFRRQISKYGDLPACLFVRSITQMNLIED